jgi:hypothetical protein
MAKCLKSKGVSSVITGRSGLVLSIDEILLYSPSRPLKLVAAIAISSPATQSTAEFRVI